MTQLPSSITDAFGKIEEVLGDGIEMFLWTPFCSLSDYYLSLGSWIRRNLLKNGSELLELLASGGLDTKENMSEFIIAAFYIYKNIEASLNK